MNTFFVDTGYLIALEASDDKNHIRAHKHWLQLINTQPSFVSTSYVFDEVVTFFNSRNRHDKAVEIGNRLLNSPSFHLIRVDDILFQKGWEYFKKHADKHYSLTDCISFVVMNQMKIQSALAFDKHFTQASFQTLPDRI